MNKLLMIKKKCNKIYVSKYTLQRHVEYNCHEGSSKCNDIPSVEKIKDTNKNYQIDIRDWKLDKKGFCQGVVYKDVLKDIYEIK